MSIEMQLQMRRNVEEMHQSVADLDSWLGDIGKRDAALRGVAPTGGKSGQEDDGTDEEEEAREIEEAKEELRRLSEAQDKLDAQSSVVDTQAKTAEKPKKKTGGLTHAQKYGQWERYDVDGVVSAMEERDAERERLRKEVVRLENQRAQAKARKAAVAAAAAADALKLQGNEAFGSARYEEAVGLYTDALGHAPRSAPLYANRALALLKLHAYAEAEEDCDAALLIDGSFVKAMLRRAQARHSLENYDGALEDLESALEREPKNSGARSLMAECRRLKAAAAPKPKPRLVKLSIETVQHDPDNDNDPFVSTLVPPPAPSEHAEPSVEAAAATRAVDASEAAQPAVDEHATADADTNAPPAATATAASPVSRPPSGAPARVVPSTTAPRAEHFGTPSSLAELERAWRSLRGVPSEFASLLRRLEPARLQELFKSNLPAEILSAILIALDTTFFPELAARALEVLQSLTHAGRFSILIMCLDKADMKALASIFGKLDQAHQDGALPADIDLARLRKQYA